MPVSTILWSKRFFLLIVLLSTQLTIFSQSKVTLTDQQLIIEQAERELNDAFSPPEGELYKAISSIPVSNNTYIFDITIQNKGEITTVFAVNPGEGDIVVRNKLENIIRQYKLSFKMPKNKRFKFQYSINY